MRTPYNREFRYGCPWCNARFKRLSHWTRHMFEEMYKRPTTMCGKCRGKFKDKQMLIDHLLSYRCYKTFPISICGFCDFKCGNERNRIVHERHCNAAFELMIVDQGTDLFSSSQEIELDIAADGIDILNDD